MASLGRKLKRNKQKEFIKNFKKTMKNFEKVVQCVGCERIPDTLQGEKIDDWHMENKNGKIKLTCPSCFGGEKNVN